MKRDEFKKGLRAMLNIWEAGGQEALERVIQSGASETIKVYNYKSFGETIVFAESLGWEDMHGDSSSERWTPSDADECEEDALEFIRGKGYRIVGLD